MEDKDISRCWQYSGYHVYGAGPCFNTRDMAELYKRFLDKHETTWMSEEERTRNLWYVYVERQLNESL